MSSLKSESAGQSVVCPTCGKQLPAEAKFCGFDGTALGVMADKTVAPQHNSRATALDKDNRVCPQCSTVYPGYAMFCSVDATKLVNVGEVADKTGLAQLWDEHYATAPLEVDDQIPTTELIGHTVGGRYRLEEFIGEGGMAFVYRATHVTIEKPVVIKILQGRLLANEKSVQRFERECKVTAKISHPNVVSVFDVGLINGNQPYLVMEYIKGDSLRDKIDKEGSMPLAMVAAILVQICRGLQEVHNMGVIHRDLKPENILLQEHSYRPDWVKLVDFGIAQVIANAGVQRLTKTGSVIGTAEYMAPEQLRDFPLDHRVDLYALGIILYEMLTARLPFEAETTEAMLLKILMDPPEAVSQYRPDVASGSPFDVMLQKALQKDPEKRYQSATEVRLEADQIYAQLMRRRKTDDGSS